MACALLACEQDAEHSCAAVLCAGNGVDVPVVDEAGDSVAVKGEWRASGQVASPEPFDCTISQPLAPVPDCDGNVLHLGAILQGNTSLELHFKDPSGAWSEWLPVAMTLEAHTDPDFNGPGCPCTWYSASAEPLIVPAASRW